MADTEAVQTSTDAVTDQTNVTDAKAPDAGAGTIIGGEADAPKADAEGKTEGKEGDQPDKPKVEVPEKYEFKLPEGQELDAALLEKATPLLKEAGLTNDQANKLAPLVTEIKQQITEQAQQQQLDHWVAQNETWIGQIKADKELGATESVLGETKTLCARAISAYTDSPEEAQAVRKALADTYAGNNPSLVRFFRRVGNSVSEDQVIRTGQPAGEVKDVAQKLYGSTSPS